MNHRPLVLVMFLAAVSLGLADKASPVRNLARADDRVNRGAFDTRTEEPADDTSRWYPLKVGNTWRYLIGESKFQLKVARIEKIGDQPCAAIEMSVNSKVQAVEHVVVKDGAVWRYAFENKQAEPPIKFLDKPGQIGNTWEVKSTIGAEKLAGTFKIGKVDEVKVPAGTFRNVITASSDNMDANGQKIAFVYYFAKDVGMIKQTIKIAGQEVNTELEKFEPAGSK